MSRVATTLRLVGFLRPLAGWVAVSVLLAAGTVASNIGLLGTSAYLIAQAALHPSVAALQVAIVGVRFFGIARSLLRYLERLASHSANFRLLAGLRAWVYQRLEPLAPAGLMGSRRGDLLDRLVADIEGLEDFYVRAVAPPFTALLVTLGMGLFLGVSFPGLGAVLAGGLAFSGLGVPWLAGRLGRRPGAQWVAARAQLATELVDGIQGMPDLLAFGRDADYLSGLQASGGGAARAQLRLAARGGLANALNGLITHLTLWVMLVAAIPLVRDGGMEGVTLAVVALVTLASFEATLPLGPAAQRLEAALQSAERLFAAADLPLPVTPPVAPAPAPASADLRIVGLTFGYAPDLPPALADFALDLPVGRRVGLVGPSGAGKSTLVNLLMRFWEYEHGSIRLDGRELREYAFDDVRSQISVVGQNPTLFNGTLRANLLLARPAASQTELEQALAQVQLADWAARLPRGLDTWVGERGVQISGGERQRLAVARGLLRAAPIWLLDEPTAHLDPANRRAVTALLLEMTRGRSVIWITHELSELAEMDEVIVLKDGTVVERGAPRDLTAQGGWYARWSQNRVF